MPQTKRQRGANYSDDESVILSSSDKENSANRRQRKSKKRTKDSSPTQADTTSTQLLPGTQKGHGKAFYDPEQSVDDRRKIRRELRAFQRTITDNKKKHAKGDFKLLQGSFCTSNKLFTGVKQTSDATIDSGALVMLADDSLTSMQRMDLADGAAVGIDLDDFALKVMKFMRKGPNPPERNRGNVDWAYLGRKVAQGVHKRPPSTPFMYGPIAIKKKVRQVHARRERLRYDERNKVAPITLKDSEIKAAEQTTPLLVQDCYKALEDYMIDHPEDEVRGIDVFRFTINPHSFNQSVENLFYLSFLVRDGRSAILDREGGSGLATTLAEPVTVDDEGVYEKKPRKHLIISINMAKWRKFIEEFNITEPLIPHRAPVWKGPSFLDMEISDHDDEEEELPPLPPLEDYMKEHNLEDFGEEEPEEDAEILEIMRKYGGLGIVDA